MTGAFESKLSTSPVCTISDYYRKPAAKQEQSTFQEDNKKKEAAAKKLADDYYNTNPRPVFSNYKGVDTDTMKLLLCKYLEKVVVQKLLDEAPLDDAFAIINSMSEDLTQLGSQRGNFLFNCSFELHKKDVEKFYSNDHDY